MFSKKILKEEIESLKSLKSERDTCKNLLHQCIKELIESINLDKNEIEDEKSVIFDLNNNLTELNREINILEERVFLNYTNKFKIVPTSTNPVISDNAIPHISSIDS